MTIGIYYSSIAHFQICLYKYGYVLSLYSHVLSLYSHVLSLYSYGLSLYSHGLSLYSHILKLFIFFLMDGIEYFTGDISYVVTTPKGKLTKPSSPKLNKTPSPKQSKSPFSETISKCFKEKWWIKKFFRCKEEWWIEKLLRVICFHFFLLISSLYVFVFVLLLLFCVDLFTLHTQSLFFSIVSWQLKKITNDETFLFLNYVTVLLGMP